MMKNIMHNFKKKASQKHAISKSKEKKNRNARLEQLKKNWKHHDQKQKTKKKEKIHRTSSMKNLQKKGIKITTKIQLMAILPIVLISVISVAIAGKNQEDTAYRLIEEKLKAVSWDVETLYQQCAVGDYSYQMGILRKGGRPLSSDNSIVDKIKEKSGLEVTLFWGNTRIVTTLEDEKGNRMVETVIEDDFVDDILSGKKEYAFIKNNQIEGLSDYCGYYIPLKQSTGEIVGMIFAGRANADIEKEIFRSKLGMMVAMLIVFVITTIAVYILADRIMKALKYTITSLNDVSDGKLNFAMHQKMLERADELGEMSQSIQDLIDEFKKIVTNLQNSAGELGEFTTQFDESFMTIAENIANVNSAVEEIANGANSQANETMETNQEIVRMGESIEHVVSDITLLNQNSTKMNEYSKYAENILSELFTIATETSEAINEVKEQTNLTNESSKSIQSATDMITSIAAQTNLLSLNASIEAARAGEHGRGFAVVADEIRKLSQQSADAADQIMSIISELLYNSDTSVKTMNLVEEKVGQQNDKLANTKEMFISLNQEITDVFALVESIRKNMDELENIKQMVMTSVSQLTAIAEQNAASTEETSASMLELRDIVKQCQKDTEKLIEMSAEFTEHTQRFTV